MTPLCANSQLRWRNGWQFVCCTGVPVVARMCARKIGASTWAASSRTLTSLHAGLTLRYRHGLWLPAPYQPSPKPSPFVVSTPIRECRLWSMREYSLLYRSSSMRIGVPEYASHRHMEEPPRSAWGLRNTEPHGGAPV